MKTIYIISEDYMRDNGYSVLHAISPYLYLHVAREISASQQDKEDG